MRVRPDRARLRPVFVAGTYLALAFVAHLNAWTGGPADRIQMSGGDLPTYLWGLRWVPYALTHGHNPFFSNWLNYPAGVNVLNNTTAILLAVLAAPVTVAWGPLASYNVLQTLAFAGSALAASVLLRRWTAWWPAAYAGGLLYGFSPFMVAAGWAHLFLIFAPVLPLIVLCLDELFVRQQGSPVRWGCLLALLVVAQFFISAEMLADTVVLCGAGALLLALLGRHQVRANVGHAVKGLLVCAGAAGAVLAYPIWFTFFGPQHVRVKVPADIVNANLLSPVVPNSNHVLTPGFARHLGDSFSGPIAFMGRTYVIAGINYLGIPLLLVLVAIVVRYRRLILVRLFAALTVLAFVAALGPKLRFAYDRTNIPLPGWILTKVPLLNAAAPYRYGVFIPLGAAVLLAVGLDRFRAELESRSSVRRRRWVVPAVALFALVPLIPRFPYSVTAVPTPEYFRSNAARAIPAGSVVVLYPFPGPLSAETMVWQARNDFRFRMVGGYQNLPDGHGGFSHAGNLSVTKDVLDGLFARRSAPPVTPSLRDRIIDDLRRWNAHTVVVDTSAVGAEGATGLFTAVLGRPPSIGHGVAVWYGIRQGQS